MSGLLRALFVLYCVEAGLFLSFVPWREGWQRLLTEFPIESVRAVLVSPFGRGAITGFGLIHLVWGVHDLRALLRRPSEAPISSAQASTSSAES